MEGVVDANVYGVVLYEVDNSIINFGKAIIEANNNAANSCATYGVRSPSSQKSNFNFAAGTSVKVNSFADGSTAGMCFTGGGTDNDSMVIIVEKSMINVHSYNSNDSEHRKIYGIYMGGFNNVDSNVSSSLNISDDSSINVTAKNAEEVYGLHIGSKITHNHIVANLGKVDISAHADKANGNVAAVYGCSKNDTDDVTINIAGGTLSAKRDDGKNVYAIKAVGNKTTVNVNNGTSNDVKITGDISAFRDDYYLAPGIINLNLNTADSFLNGAILEEGFKDTDVDRGTSLTLADGATWNVSDESKVANLIANDGILADNGRVITAKKLSGEKLSLEHINGGKLVVDELSGAQLTLNMNSLEAGQIEIIANGNADGTATKLTVQGVGLNEEIVQKNEADKVNGVAGLQELLDTIAIKNNSAEVEKVSSDAGAVVGSVSAKVEQGEIGELVVVKETVKEEENKPNAGTASMDGISLLAWRSEMNDMNKRLGELRDSVGEHGAWVRMTRGKTSYQDVRNQYNAYQIGYDEKLSNDKTWTVGAALTYTDGKSSFALGGGENRHKGLAIYGSKLNADGSFIDLIAKYSRLEHDYNVNGGIQGEEFNTNGYSLSAEYGKRFTNDAGLWLEPQVELTYGVVSGVDYMNKAKTVNIHRDSMKSLVGRLGFALGKNLPEKRGNVYARASYLYDFDGETSVTMAKGVARSFKQDLGGGWWEVGVGANVNLSPASHLYFDVEKTFGGEVTTNWQWNVGLRYSF